MTPIYLLSTLRRVFYGKANSELVIDKYFADAKPREIFITACLLLPIIGIGLYPKMAMQIYDVKTVAVAAQVRNAYASTSQVMRDSAITAPQLSMIESKALVGVVK
ncbi:MAG: hypothetical protein WBG73_18870 [Coleofasciculaceae cyanobacterium]